MCGHIFLGYQYFTHVDDCAHSVGENVEYQGKITMYEYKGEGNVSFFYGSVRCYMVTKYGCRLMITNIPVFSESVRIVNYKHHFKNEKQCHLRGFGCELFVY